jgi:hypothetical protein
MGGIMRILLSSLLFSAILLASGMANATYLENLDIYQYSVGGNISWSHTYDFSEPNPIDYARLTIVADDVDYGEQDGVFLNGTLLGYLTELPDYSNWGYVPGPGGNLTTSIFDIDISLLDWTLPINISIASNWGVEIETSTLEVQGAAPVPEPSTLLLLGCGLAGLARCRRKRK